MSWSFSHKAKPAELLVALESYGAGMNAQSKLEFDAAKPHLLALVAENFVAADSGYTEPTLELSAYGHGTAKGTGDDLQQLQRSCSVNLRTV